MIKVRLVGTDGTALRAGRLRNYDQNIDGADEPDRIPVTVGDPDNDIDPDDVANPDVIAPPLPPMPRTRRARVSARPGLLDGWLMQAC